jgi:hypothetical protein
MSNLPKNTRATVIPRAFAIAMRNPQSNGYAERLALRNISSCPVSQAAQKTRRSIWNFCSYLTTRFTSLVLASDLEEGPARAQFPLTNGSVHHRVPPSCALLWGSRRVS